MRYNVFITQVGRTQRYISLEIDAESHEEAKTKTEERLEEVATDEWEYQEWFDVDADQSDLTIEET